jgi:hypothetical protein
MEEETCLYAVVTCSHAKGCTFSILKVKYLLIIIHGGLREKPARGECRSDHNDSNYE